MKENWKFLPTLVALFAAVPAYAVDTTQTYHSGILVLGFLAFCALILVVQLFPSLMLLYGWIKGMFHKAGEAEDKKTVNSH